MSKELFPAKGIGQHERIPPSSKLKPPPEGEALPPHPDPEGNHASLRVPHTLDEVIWHLIRLRQKYGGSTRTSIHHLTEHRSYDGNILQPF